ncbi:MAG: right-handed parallel beta-helix repeat-containing protein [Myxococcota bacterium]
MLWFALPAFATDWVVDPSGGGDYLTIEQGIDRAASGDTLLVKPGVYPERLILRGKDLTLRSTDGPEVTTIRDGWQNSLILVDGADAVVEGFDITSADIKHCVRVRVGSVTLRDDVIHGCDAYDGLGGGLRTDVGTSAFVDGCRFYDNRAHFTIGARAPHIYARGDRLEVRNSTFSGGESEGDCGGVMVIGGDNVIEDNWFEGNAAADDGGAFYADGRPTVFPDGTANDGTQSLVLARNTFVGNVAADRGGAMFLIGMPQYDIRENVICGNTSADRGGGVYVESWPADGTFAYNVVQENVSEAGQGGGVFALNGVPALVHNDFLGNTGGERGGALAYKDAALTFRHNLVAWTRTGDGVWAQFGVTVDDWDYDAWWSNLAADVAGVLQPGAHDVFADPLLPGVSLDGDCTNDDWARAPGSPLVDGGDPAEPDPDGSPADLGAFGAFPPPTGTTGPSETAPGTSGTSGTTPGTGGPGGDGAGCGCETAAPGGWLLGLLGLLGYGVRRGAR